MKLGTDHHVPEARCIECGALFDGASAINDDARPKAGDYSICIKCGTLAVFTDELQLRAPTDDEIREVAGNKDLVEASRALVELHVNLRENAQLPGVSGPKKTS